MAARAISTSHQQTNWIRSFWGFTTVDTGKLPKVPAAVWRPVGKGLQRGSIQWLSARKASTPVHVPGGACVYVHTCGLRWFRGRPSAGLPSRTSNRDGWLDWDAHRIHVCVHVCVGSAEASAQLELGSMSRAR